MSGFLHGLAVRMPLRTAFALGLAAVAGFAPIAASPILTFSLAGLYLLCLDAAPATAGKRGLAWGLGCFLGGVSWVYVSLSQFAGMATPLAALATLAFCAYLALFPAAACYLFARWRTGGWRDPLLFAGLWCLAEWLRGTLLTGFPWLAVGYSQTPPSPLAGYAAVLGVYGVGMVAVLLGALLCVLLRCRGRAPGAWLAIAAALAGGAVLRGMAWTVPAGEPLAVNLLQGNIEQSLKWEPGRLSLSTQRYLQLAEQQPASLTVLPETALPLFFNEVPREVLHGLTRYGDAILGVVVGLRGGGYTNGAVAVAPDLHAQAYAKRHLVPFGEYAPPGFAWFFRFARIPMADFTAGPAMQEALRVGGQRIAVNICYEDLFGEELLPALGSATLLLNLSNTAWFGDSLAQPQHLQIARMRALETGRTMLRATNTGMTAMVLPDGSVAAALPPFTHGALHVAAPPFTGLTPYARWGNGLALLLALLACLAARRKRG